MPRPTYIIYHEYNLQGRLIRDYLNVSNSERAARELCRRLNYGRSTKLSRFDYIKQIPQDWFDLDLDYAFPPDVKSL